MASKINTNKIDNAFPISGIDNDTEGFRTNFTEIKQGLDNAKLEIDDILANTARTDSESDFNGTTIVDAQLQATTLQVYDNGSQNNNYSIDFAAGHYQIIDVTSDMNITLTNWPQDSRYARLILAITNSSQQSVTITWLTEQSGQIKKNKGSALELYDSTDGFNTNTGSFPHPFTVEPTSDEHVVEFWTANSGIVVFADYKGQYV